MQNKQIFEPNSFGAPRRVCKYYIGVLCARTIVIEFSRVYSYRCSFLFRIQNEIYVLFVECGMGVAEKINNIFNLSEMKACEQFFWFNLIFTFEFWLVKRT